TRHTRSGFIRNRRKDIVMFNNRSLICNVLPVFAALASPAQAAETSLNDLLAPYTARYELPALAAAVVKDGVIVAAGAVGTRRYGAQSPVTLNDRFHLGSDTKAMTALLCAMFVEEGKLRWDSTVGDVFSEITNMDAGLRRVTITQLLSHTSGIPGDNEVVEDLLGKAIQQDGNLDEMRYWLVREWAKQPLQSAPGASFAYANMGYVIAGAILERISGKTWEELITERVFVPLKLDSAGLGPQSSVGRIDSPVAHAVIDGKTKAFLAGPNGDNPLILGPAGLAHMSVLDFARWAGWNAGQGKRAPALVSATTLRKLHAPVIAMPVKPDAPPGTPPGGRYALGSGELQVDWAPEPLMYHGGSNGKNLAHIWVDAKRDFAMVIVTNIGGTKADDAFRAIAPVLYTRFANRR
ncbi:MAG TPA: serine hydrolase domain-containing protein, partial [Burkholderiales bacterium]|nr:serine hydrolase domain-containing protein [Burkholderiales bacterium]